MTRGGDAVLGKPQQAAMVIAAGLVLVGAGGGNAPARAGYLTGIDFGEQCVQVGAAAGVSVVPGVPTGVGAAERGCVTDATIRQTGVLKAAQPGAHQNARFGPYTGGGGASGSTFSRAGVGRIAWTGGLVSHTFYLTNSRSTGSATVCARIRDFDGVLLSSHCQPLADGAITISAPLAPMQYHQASVELTADYTFPTANTATVTVSRYTSLLP